MGEHKVTVGMQRKLAAIFSTDVAGYSRLMGDDEEATIRTLTAYRALISSLIQQYRGRVVDAPGDNLLAEFASVVDAVRCAVEIQHELKVKNAELSEHRRMQFRIGINLGDVIVEGERLYGDGVNIAARMESLAVPGGLCLAGAVYEQVKNKLALSCADLGKQVVKNIAEPVRVYRVVMDATAITLAEQAVLRQAQSHSPDEAKRNLGTPPPPGLRSAPSRLRLVIVASLLLIGATIVAIRHFSFPTPSTQPPTLSTQAAPAALPLPDKPSLVVLPFVNMSKDPDQEYFSDGLTDVLTGDLSKISSLFVIARNSAFTYKGKAVKVQDVGREMGVRYVLEGSVQKADQQVRITVQLIDATTDSHLWSERYDRPLKDIFALQDEIVKKIVTTLKLQLTLQEQGYIVRKHTDNLEAYDSLLRGAEHFHRLTKEANAPARQMYEKAIALDPQYAEAYAELSSTYYVEWLWRWSPGPEALEQALAMAQRAVGLDDSLPSAHRQLGMVYALKQQYDQAIAEGERAIALDPNNADSYAGQAEALNFAGRPEDALRMVKQAMRFNPRSPAWYLNLLGWASRSTGRYEEAIAALKIVLLQNPNFLTAYLHLATSYLWQWVAQQSPAAQSLEPALAAAQRAVALNDSYWGSHTILGTIYLWQKQYDQALAEMEQRVNFAPTEAWSRADLAEVLSRVGRSEEALETAEKALRLKPAAVDMHLDYVGAAYYLAGRPEEAIAPLKQYLTHYPNILGAHLTLTAVYSELGKEAEAQAEAAEVLRLNPKFSLEVHKERVPIKDPAMLERHIAALRKAGLK